MHIYIYGSWHVILQLYASTSCMEIKHVSSQGKTLVRGQRLAGCLERNRYKKSEHFEWKFHLILSTEIEHDLRYWYFFLISVLYANWWSCKFLWVSCPMLQVCVSHYKKVTCSRVDVRIQSLGLVCIPMCWSSRMNFLCRSKVRKKGQKRIRQARFAFMTKSEVDHLEDGYRWRKYGQKAVKNSPFPRYAYPNRNSPSILLVLISVVASTSSCYSNFTN